MQPKEYFKNLIRRAVSYGFGIPANGGTGDYYLMHGPSESGQVVSEQAALSISTAYACVEAVAQSMSTLPIRLNEKVFEDGHWRYKERPKHPLATLLDQPNEWQTATEFQRLLYWSLKFRGNFFAKVHFRGNGRPEWLEWLPADWVEVKPNKDRSSLAYKINRTDEFAAAAITNRKSEVLMPGEIIHVRGCPAATPWLGVTPITLHRETFGMGLAQRSHGSRFFRNHARPSVVITSDKTVSDESKKNLKSYFERTTRGENLYGVTVLDEGVKAVPISVSNSDGQWIESMKLNQLDMCRIFRTPPHKVQILDGSKFSNMEQQNREWVTDTLAPDGVSAEQAFTRDLLGPSDKKNGLCWRYDFAELLRGDILSQIQEFRSGIQWGYLNRNEVRARLGLDPIEGGDEYIVPKNMTIAEMLEQEMAGMIEKARQDAEAASQLQDDPHGNENQIEKE